MASSQAGATWYILAPMAFMLGLHSRAQNSRGQESHRHPRAYRPKRFHRNSPTRRTHRWRSSSFPKRSQSAIQLRWEGVQVIWDLETGACWRVSDEAVDGHRTTVEVRCQLCHQHRTWQVLRTPAGIFFLPWSS